jgi:hypothetical protein
MSLLMCSFSLKRYVTYWYTLQRYCGKLGRFHLFDKNLIEGTSKNVSVVNTATNLVIGKPLISWTDYTKGSWTPPTNETQFSVTIPTDLGTKCSTAGACVLQWWWDDRSTFLPLPCLSYWLPFLFASKFWIHRYSLPLLGIDQTFVDCVDFTA